MAIDTATELTLMEALKISEESTFSFSKIVSTGTSIVQIGIQVAQKIGLIDSQDAQLASIENSIKNIDNKIDKVISMLNVITDKIERNIIKNLDDSIKNYMNAEKRLLGSVFDSMPEKKEGFKKLFESNNEDAIKKIIALISEVPIDTASAKDLSEKWENVCNFFSDTTTSNFDWYQDSPLALYDKKINSIFNWDEEAYIYRKRFRLRIEEICTRGAVICTMFERARNPKLKNSTVNQDKLKEVLAYLAKHHANRKRQFNADGTVDSTKNHYCLVNNSYISSCQVIESVQLTDEKNINKNNVAFNNAVIEEMCKRAQGIKDVVENNTIRGRTLKEDLVKNELIAANVTTTKVLSNEFNYSYKKGSNNSRTYEQWLVRGQIMDLNDTNPHFSERCIFNKFKYEETVFLWITRNSESIDNNEGSLICWRT